MMGNMMMGVVTMGFMTMGDIMMGDIMMGDMMIGDSGGYNDGGYNGVRKECRDILKRILTLHNLGRDLATHTKHRPPALYGNQVIRLLHTLNDGIDIQRADRP